jgi:hypothetical protein
MVSVDLGEKEERAEVSKREEEGDWETYSSSEYPGKNTAGPDWKLKGWDFTVVSWVLLGARYGRMPEILMCVKAGKCLLLQVMDVGIWV